MALREHLKVTGRGRDSYREQLHFSDGGALNPRGKDHGMSRFISKESYDMATSTPPADGYEAITSRNWRHILIGEYEPKRNIFSGGV